MVSESKMGFESNCDPGPSHWGSWPELLQKWDGCGDVNFRLDFAVGVLKTLCADRRGLPVLELNSLVRDFQSPWNFPGKIKVHSHKIIWKNYRFPRGDSVIKLTKWFPLHCTERREHFETAANLSRTPSIRQLMVAYLCWRSWSCHYMQKPFNQIYSSFQ